MGLQLASHELSDGRKATVYLNEIGPFLATKKAPEDLKCGELPRSKEALFARWIRAEPSSATDRARQLLSRTHRKPT